MHQGRDIYKCAFLTTVSIKNRADANCYTYFVMFIVIKLFYRVVFYIVFVHKKDCILMVSDLSPSIKKINKIRACTTNIHFVVQKISTVVRLLIENLGN